MGLAVAQGPSKTQGDQQAEGQSQTLKDTNRTLQTDQDREKLTQGCTEPETPRLTKR